MAIDPICKMTVEPEQAAAKTEHDGTTYYFCCEGCLKTFQANPENYITGGEGGE